MRTVIFATLVLYLILSGIWGVTYDTVFPLDSSMLTSLSSQYFLGNNSDSEHREKDKANILTRNWAFQTRFDSPESINIFHGEIDYKPDSTFLRYVTFESFSSDFKYAKNNPSDVAGGSISGTWRVDENGNWREYCEKCIIKVSYSFYSRIKSKDICQYFPIGKPLIYGTYQTDLYKSELVEFTNSKIQINKKSFQTGEIDRYSLTAK